MNLMPIRDLVKKTSHLDPKKLGKDSFTYVDISSVDKDTKKITSPTLLIVGTRDEPTPPSHVRMFYNKLFCPKEFHIIKNAPHTFRDAKHLSQIKQIMKKWIKKVNK